MLPCFLKRNTFGMIDNIILQAGATEVFQITKEGYGRSKTTK